VKKLSIEQRYHRVDLARFEETFFSEAFNDSIADQVGMRERQLLEEKELGDDKVELVTRWVAKVRLPKVLAKLAGTDEVSYVERSVRDRSAHTLRFQIEHPFPRRLQIHGIMRFEAAEGGVRQLLETEVTVSVPGLRGLIERLIEGELRKAYARKLEIMQRYLDQHA
jgi:hypothetical protein